MSHNYFRTCCMWSRWRKVNDAGAVKCFIIFQCLCSFLSKNCLRLVAREQLPATAVGQVLTRMSVVLETVKLAPRGMNAQQLPTRLRFVRLDSIGTSASCIHTCSEPVVTSFFSQGNCPNYFLIIVSGLGETACKNCSLGTYKTNTGSGTCEICPAGSKCPNTVDSPVVCNAGEYR